METSLPEGFLPGAVLRRVTMAGLLGRHALEGDAELGGHYLGGGGTRRAGSFFAVRARIVSTSSLYCSISRCDGAIRSSG